MPGDPEPRAVCTRHGRSSRTPDCLADTRNRGGRLAVHRDYRRAKATSKPANRSVPQWRPAPNPQHHLPPHRLPPSRRRRPGQPSRSDPKWPITPQSRRIDYHKSFAAGLFTAEPKATAGPTQPIIPAVANLDSNHHKECGARIGQLRIGASYESVPATDHFLARPSHATTRDQPARPIRVRNRHVPTSERFRTSARARTRGSSATQRFSHPRGRLDKRRFPHARAVAGTRVGGHAHVFELTLAIRHSPPVGGERPFAGGTNGKKLLDCPLRIALGRGRFSGAFSASFHSGIGWPGCGRHRFPGRRKGRTSAQRIQIANLFTTISYASRMASARDGRHVAYPADGN